MPEYELTFELPRVSESIEDSLVDRLDATIAEHAGVPTVTVLLEAPDCVTAARTVIEILAGLGAPPIRLIDDLVTRTQIAERVGISRQAVGLWVSGQRKVTTAFPSPFVLTAGGLWRWDEVLPAVRRLGYTVEDNAEYPTRRDSQIIGGMLAARSRDSATVLARAILDNVHVATSPNGGVQATSAPTTVRFDFGLAA